MMVCLSLGSPASAMGPFNVPSSLRQFCGYGNGAGYHAPLVLQVPLLRETASQPIQYKLRPPKSSTYAPDVYGSMSALQAVPHDVYYGAAPAMAPAVPMRVTTPPRPTPRTPVEPASPSDNGQPERIALPRGGF